MTSVFFFWLLLGFALFSTYLWIVGVIFFHVSCAWGSLSLWICWFIVCPKFGKTFGNCYCKCFSFPPVPSPPLWGFQIHSYQATWIFKQPTDALLISFPSHTTLCILFWIVYINVFKFTNLGVSQLVKSLTLDFGSGHDFRVVRSSPS